MSYIGWDGSQDFDTVYDLIDALNELKRSDIDKNVLIEMNDSGFTFEEIADYLDRIDN